MMNFFRKYGSGRRELETVCLGPGIQAKVLDKMYWVRPSLADMERNLRLAEEGNVKPLSVGEVLKQIDERDVPRIVLFDTPPVRGFVGNHWRALEIDKNAARLQLCDSFGQQDFEVSPVEISLDKPICTGVILEEFSSGGFTIPLSLVVVIRAGDDKQLNENLTWREIVLWSDSKGRLKERK